MCEKKKKNSAQHTGYVFQCTQEINVVNMEKMKQDRSTQCTGWGMGQEGGVCVGVTNIYMRKPSFSKTGSVRIAKQGGNPLLRQ